MNFKPVVVLFLYLFVFLVYGEENFNLLLNAAFTTVSFFFFLYFNRKEKNNNKIKKKKGPPSFIPFSEIESNAHITGYVLFALAVDLFNNRREDVIPDLKQIRSCNVKLNPIAFCDNSCSPIIATKNILEVVAANKTIHGAVGLVCNSESTSFATLANALGR